MATGDMFSSACAGLFEIRSPQTTGFTNGTDATTSGPVFDLAGTTTGTLDWLIVPVKASALSGPTTYYVGGSLTYAVLARVVFERDEALWLRIVAGEHARRTWP